MRFPIGTFASRRKFSDGFLQLGLDMRSKDNIMVAQTWNLLDQSAYPLLLECEKRGALVRNIHGRAAQSKHRCMKSGLSTCLATNSEGSECSWQPCFAPAYCGGRASTSTPDPWLQKIIQARAPCLLWNQLAGTVPPEAADKARTSISVSFCW